METSTIKNINQLFTSDFNPRFAAFSKLAEINHFQGVEALIFDRKIAHEIHRRSSHTLQIFDRNG